MADRPMPIQDGPTQIFHWERRVHAAIHDEKTSTHDETLTDTTLCRSTAQLNQSDLKFCKERTRKYTHGQSNESDQQA